MQWAAGRAISIFFAAAKLRLGEPGAPGPDSAYRELPPDHPLFTMEATVENPPHLMAVSNGLRELWIHSTIDYSAIWQSRDLSKKEAWDLPRMLYSYVAGSEELRSKLADFYAQRTVTKRPILPQDCAAAIAWLAGDQSAKTTGHVIPVDGGLSEAFLR